MSLEVTVRSATDLPRVDLLSASDPVATITFRGHVRKTDVIKDDCNPKWNKTFVFDLCCPLNDCEVLAVSVADQDEITDKDILGNVAIPFDALIKSGATDSSYELQPKADKPATIAIAMAYKAPPDPYKEKEENLSKLQQQLEAKESEMQQRENELKQEAAAIQKKKDELDTREKELIRTQEELFVRVNEVAQKEKKMTEDLKKWNAGLDDREEEIEKAEKQVKEGQETLEQREREAEKKSTLADKRRKELDGRELQLNKRKEALTKGGKDLAKKEEDLAKIDEDLAKREEDLAVREEELAAERKTLDARKQPGKDQVKFELPFTQTSHVITAACALGLGVFVFTGRHNTAVGMWRLVSRFCHLFSFSSWFGTQSWVSFVAGIVMYSNLPRHTFGMIQSKLFPRYFQTGAIMLTIALSTFVIEHPYSTWDSRLMLQAGLLGSSLLMVLANLLILQPRASKIMFEKHAIEEREGAGGSIGQIDKEKLKKLMEDKTYKSLTRRFVVYHSLSAISNLISLSVEVVHLWCLATNLNTV